MLFLAAFLYCNEQYWNKDIINEPKRSALILKMLDERILFVRNDFIGMMAAGRDSILLLLL